MPRRLPAAVCAPGSRRRKRPHQPRRALFRQPVARQRGCLPGRRAHRRDHRSPGRHRAPPGKEPDVGAAAAGHDAGRSAGARPRAARALRRRGQRAAHGAPGPGVRAAGAGGRRLPRLGRELRSFPERPARPAGGRRARSRVEHRRPLAARRAGRPSEAGDAQRRGLRALPPRQLRAGAAHLPRDRGGDRRIRGRRAARPAIRRGLRPHGLWVCPAVLLRDARFPLRGPARPGGGGRRPGARPRFDDGRCLDGGGVAALVSASADVRGRSRGVRARDRARSPKRRGVPPVRRQVDGIARGLGRRGGRPPGAGARAGAANQLGRPRRDRVRRAPLGRGDPLGRQRARGGFDVRHRSRPTRRRSVAGRRHGRCAGRRELAQGVAFPCPPRPARRRHHRPLAARQPAAASARGDRLVDGQRHLRSERGPRGQRAARPGPRGVGARPTARARVGVLHADAVVGPGPERARLPARVRGGPAAVSNGGRLDSRTVGRILGVAAVLAVGPTTRPSFAQCPDGSPPPCRRSGVLPNSVAVLYLDNLSPDTADAYLADGLTEEIASRLGDIKRLLVKQASREGIRRLVETAPDYRVAAGRAFGVRYLVEGSVRRAGSRIRVVVRLVNAATGFRVWSQTYDESTGDLLRIEEAIAGQVTTAIAGELAPTERQGLSVRPTADPAAYEHFLRGTFFIAKRSPDGLRRAIAEYEAAVRRDPQFTRAIAREALAYELSFFFGWALPGLPLDSIRARTIALANRAREQDSTVSDAWLATANARSFLSPRTLDGVTAALERALALDPRNAEALNWTGFFLRALGQDSAARAAYFRSLAIEPERPVSLNALGVMSFIERRYDDSRRWLDSSLRVNPGFYLGYLRRARTRLALGDHAGARTDAEVAQRLGGADSTPAEALLAMADAQAGDTTTGLARLRDALGAPRDTTRELDLERDLLVAAALVTLGECQQALRYLEGMRPRGANRWYAMRAPEFDSLRPEPRFRRLIEESRPPSAPQ